MSIRRLLGAVVVLAGVLIGANPAAAGGHDLTFPSATSTVVNSGADGRLGTFLCCFWSAARGDRVEEMVTTHLSSVEAASLSFEVPFNYLASGQTVVLELVLDGTVVATHTVPRFFTGPVTMAATDLGVAGGDLAVVLRVANEVPSGGGAIGISEVGSLQLEGPSVVAVPVDVRPGSDDNPVSLRARGLVPVAVRSTAAVDVTTADPATACFGDPDTPAERACGSATGGHVDDVDGDGLADLVLHFPTQRTGLDRHDTEACLTATLAGGLVVEGCDAVTVR